MIDNERSSITQQVKVERNGRVVTIFLIQKDEYSAMLRYDMLVNELNKGILTLNIVTLDGRVSKAGT